MIRVNVLLDIESEILDNLPSSTLKFVDFELKIKHQNKFVENYILLLSSNHSDLLDSLISNAIDSLNDEQEEYAEPVLSFDIIQSYTKHASTSKEGNAVLNGFISQLPNYVTDAFVKQPVELLITFSKLGLTSNVNINEIINFTFLKLSQPTSIEMLLSEMKRIVGFDILKCPDINKYLHEKSEIDISKLSIEDKSGDLMFQFLTPQILQNIYSGVGDAEFDNFVERSNRYYNNTAFLGFSLEHPEFLKKLVLKSDCPGPRDLLKKIETNISNADFEKQYVEVLRESVSLEDHRKVLTVVENLGNTFAEGFLPSSLELKITSVLSTELDPNLVISNPLEKIIYFFKVSTDYGSFFTDKVALEKLFALDTASGIPDGFQVNCYIPNLELI
ncbi:unnamed protein product [Ambrosiozyma monospora]|uniref:Unnamed protein product n=1 Tax=Ambrosiozyma monospora TaxID=43982 RepID=A0ACB5TB85_AMBMO|nr:unnamed protein product [Ambrosiozyma monospora]